MQISWFVTSISFSTLILIWIFCALFSGNPREDSETATAAQSPAKVSHPTSSSSTIGAIAETQQQPNNSETTNMLLVQAHHHQVRRQFYQLIACFFFALSFAVFFFLFFFFLLTLRFVKNCSPYPLFWFIIRRCCLRLLNEWTKKWMILRWENHPAAMATKTVNYSIMVEVLK